MKKLLLFIVFINLSNIDQLNANFAGECTVDQLKNYTQIPVTRFGGKYNTEESYKCENDCNGKNACFATHKSEDWGDWAECWCKK